MENLAPAGNRAALERADAAGADAVYLGYSTFSARAGAGNFNRQELEDAIRYAHLRHMRVHVTVNTLVKDGELAQVTEVLRLLNDLHADAVLVQDLGVLRIARNLFPDLTVHASTQMAIHNRTGVIWCGKHGIRRAVLARECSLEEIRKCADTGVEIEVFVHGAQCVAVSGLCLFSSMVGERSGNRGRCAQPCRMEYDYRGRRGAWLSPRDVCLRDELPKLQEAGVASIKLEGRLKRPEYVAVVAGSYRKGLDSLERGAFEKADRKEKEDLLQIFNRGGFMNGYALGCEDAGVIFPEGVNHQGIRMGRITAADGKLAHVKLEKDLQNGDGLALRGEHEETGLVYSGPDMKAGGTAIIRLRPGAKAAAGDAVYRLTAVNQLKAAESMKGRTVPVDLFLKAMPGEALKLTATDGESTVTVTGEIVAEAKTRAATEEELCRNLEKTGETVFEARNVKAKTAGAFVPVSLVNAIRREALGALTAERISAFETRNAEFCDRCYQKAEKPFDSCSMATVFRNLNRRDCPPGSSLVSVDLSSDEISATGSPQSFAHWLFIRALQTPPRRNFLRILNLRQSTLERCPGLFRMTHSFRFHLWWTAHRADAQFAPHWLPSEVRPGARSPLVSARIRARTAGGIPAPRTAHNRTPLHFGYADSALR